MTISTTDFGLIIDNTTVQVNMYMSIPHLSAPQKWCTDDEEMQHKIRGRLHIDSALEADVLNGKAILDDTSNDLIFSYNNISDDWATTFAGGVTMNEYPEGDPLPDALTDGKSQRFYHGMLRFLKVAADVEVNGIELGAVHDTGYGDRDVERTKTQTATAHEVKDALSSFLMTWVTCESVNRMMYSGDTDRAAWRFSVPLLGGR